MLELGGRENESTAAQKPVLIVRANRQPLTSGDDFDTLASVPSDQALLSIHQAQASFVVILADDADVE